MTGLELGWVAGFLEGEGSFNNCGPRDYPRIEARQVQREPLERLQALFGGNIYLRPKQRPTWNDSWVWHATGRHARSVMEMLLPLMSPRRQEQIRKALGRSDAPRSG